MGLPKFETQGSLLRVLARLRRNILRPRKRWQLPKAVAYRLVIQEVTGAEVVTSYTRWLDACR